MTPLDKCKLLNEKSWIPAWLFLEHRKKNHRSPSMHEYSLIDSIECCLLEVFFFFSQISFDYDRFFVDKKKTCSKINSVMTSKIFTKSLNQKPTIYLFEEFQLRCYHRNRITHRNWPWQMAKAEETHKKQSTGDHNSSSARAWKWRR